MFEYKITHDGKTWTEIAPNKATLKDTLNDLQIFDPEIIMVRRLDGFDIRASQRDTQASLADGQSSGTGRNVSGNKTTNNGRRHKAPANQSLTEVVGSLSPNETVTVSAQEIYDLVAATIDVGRAIKQDFILSLIDKELSKLKPNFFARRVTRLTKQAQIDVLKRVRQMITDNTK
jgi:hypothetical protein